MPSTKNDNKGNSTNRQIDFPSTDPAITLKFLRSAIFYLLTDAENWDGHIRAVQNILDFSLEERNLIDKMFKSS